MGRKIRPQGTARQRRRDAMKLFHKRTIVMETKNQALWKEAKRRLKDAELRHVRCGSYDSEPPVCG